MGGKKQTTSDTQQYSNSAQSATQSGMFDNLQENELGFAIKPQTQSFKDLQAWRPTADASIASRFGARRNRAISGYSNLGGGYANPELATERQMSALGDIGQEEGAEQAADAFRMNNQRLGQLGTLAGLEDPVAFNKSSRSRGTSSGQTAGTSSGQVLGKEIMTQPGKGLFGSIIGGLGTAASFAPFI